MKFKEPGEIVEWLLEGHVHFILTNSFHQGMDTKQWDILELENQIQRIKFHPGFPTGVQTMCPVFLQDKYRYLEYILEYANPTLKVPLNKNLDYSFCHSDIERYSIFTFIPV